MVSRKFPTIEDFSVYILTNGHFYDDPRVLGSALYWMWKLKKVEVKNGYIDKEGVYGMVDFINLSETMYFRGHTLRFDITLPYPKYDTQFIEMCKSLDD